MCSARDAEGGEVGADVVQRATDPYQEEKTYAPKQQRPRQQLRVVVVVELNED